jgi:NADPH2:quinone reductase
MTADTKTKVQGILVTEFGGPEVMKFADYELKEPGPGEARVKIHAAGLNFIDIYQRKGRYPVELPWVPGLEGAGVVESVGEGVKEVKVGDRVAYSSSPGAYSQASVVSAGKLIPLPKELSFEQGAAFPLQGMTAHYLLHEFYKLKKGDTVLIHAAAGGMGLLLVQWAKHLGARVIGTVSSQEKAKVAKEAGADEVINYSEQDFVKESKRLTNDVGPIYIIDGVGKDTFAKDLDAVATRGFVTIFGSASGPADPIMPNALQQRCITVHGGSIFNFVNTREALLMRANDVINGIKAGWLKLKIDHVLPLREAAKAHELLENRRTTGKVVLNCED